MKPVVVLRPEPGASATLERAQALGLGAVSLPLFVVKPLEWQAPDPVAFDALLLTSANAPRLAGRDLQRLGMLPVHAVGNATAAAARAAGLRVTTVGTAGVSELLGSLPPGQRLLHLCGEDRTDAVANQAITALPIYRSEPIEYPPGLERLHGAVALVHSPRAGARLAALMAKRDDVAVAAISSAAARACGTGWAAIGAGSEPTDAALLSLAARLCQQLDPK